MCVGDKQSVLSRIYLVFTTRAFRLCRQLFSLEPLYTYTAHNTALCSLYSANCQLDG